VAPQEKPFLLKRLFSYAALLLDRRAANHLYSRRQAKRIPYGKRRNHK
jgi:hypothetical protein